MGFCKTKGGCSPDQDVGSEEKQKEEEEGEEDAYTTSPDPSFLGREVINPVQTVDESSGRSACGPKEDE